MFGHLDTPDGSNIQGLRHSSSTSLTLLVRKLSSRQSEVSVLPLLEDPPLASLLLLQLAFNNGLGLLEFMK